MKITDINIGQAANIGKILDLLGKLDVGDVLKAQILEFTANELLLKLSDGTTVTASTMVPLDVKKGEFVDFKVKSKSDSQIFIETVKNGENKAGTENSIELKLAAIDIKPEPQNIEIAKAIESNNLTVDKNIFEKVFNAIRAFKDLNPQKAVFLASNNVNINENNIRALNDIVEGRMKIGRNLSDLMESLAETRDVKVLEKMSSSLLKLEDSKNETGNKKPGNEFEKVPPKINENTQTESNKAFRNTALNEESPVAGQGIEKALADLKQKFVKYSDKISPEEVLKQLKNPEDTGKVIEFIKSKAGSPGSFSTEDRKELENILKDVISKANKEKVKSDNTVNTKNTNHETDLKSDKGAVNLHKAFEKIYIKLDSKDIDTDLNIKKTYKDIYEKLEVIKENVVNSSIASRDDILNKIDNIQSGIRFLNEINSHSTYVQIPINILNKNTSGEIYILKRGPKREKINTENLTMYISLDTKNMGKVDSLIDLNRKNLSVNMRVREKSIQELVKDNYNELYKRLADIGYKLVDLKCRVTEEEANLLNINDIIKKEMPGSRVSIDYKI